MDKALYGLAETKKMINSGKTVILAGDEKVLNKLPHGWWIGGTIPYFMGNNGGEFNQEKIYVTQLPSYVTGVEIASYNTNNIHEVFKELPAHGFGIIIMPGGSSIHELFSLNAPNYIDFGVKPLIGWISGVYLAKLGKNTPKVYYGPMGKKLDNEAVVIKISLPANKVANIELVNIFKQGKGDSIVFETDGFEQKEVFINGEAMNFADYLRKNKIDTKLPLVADFFDTMVNVSIQKIDDKERKVSLYAPVFKGTRYKIAEPIKDYVATFRSILPKKLGNKTVFSCNCILNYLYLNLKGKKLGGFTGPITFGEIAYQLVNQTLAYLTVDDVK